MRPRAILVLVGWLAGCTVYPGSQVPPGLPSGSPPSSSSYRTVAVLPIEVAEVQVRGFTTPNAAPDTAAAARQRASRRCQKLAYCLQTALYEQLRAQQPLQGATTWLQPVRETNLRLQRAGITYENLPAQSAARLHEVLGTNALLTGQTTVSRLPLSVSLTSELLLNKMGQVPDALVTTSLTLRDSRQEQPVWQASFNSTANTALNLSGSSDLARRVAQQLPPSFPQRAARP